MLVPYRACNSYAGSLALGGDVAGLLLTLVPRLINIGERAMLSAMPYGLDEIEWTRHLGLDNWARGMGRILGRMCEDDGASNLTISSVYCEGRGSGGEGF